MTTEEQFAAELSAAVVWLDLRGVDWCVFHAGQGPRGPFLDVAVAASAATVAAILVDYQDEGFAVAVDERARIAQASGQRLRVRLHHEPPFVALAQGSTVRRAIFRQVLPVAVAAAAPDAEAA